MFLQQSISPHLPVHQASGEDIIGIPSCHLPPFQVCQVSACLGLCLCLLPGLQHIWPRCQSCRCWAQRVVAPCSFFKVPLGGVVSLLWMKGYNSFLVDSYWVCESPLVWPLPSDQFAMGDPTRCYCSQQHSSQGYRDTQTPPPCSGGDSQSITPKCFYYKWIKWLCNWKRGQTQWWISKEWSPTAVSLSSTVLMSLTSLFLFCGPQ